MSKPSTKSYDYSWTVKRKMLSKESCFSLHDVSNTGKGSGSPSLMPSATSRCRLFVSGEYKLFGRPMIIL